MGLRADLTELHYDPAWAVRSVHSEDADSPSAEAAAAGDARVRSHAEASSTAAARTLAGGERTDGAQRLADQRNLSGNTRSVSRGGVAGLAGLTLACVATIALGCIALERRSGDAWQADGGYMQRFRQLQEVRARVVATAASGMSVNLRKPDTSVSECPNFPVAEGTSACSRDAHVFVCGVFVAGG